MQKFSEFVNDYKKYREKKGMSSEITPEEVKQIRELYESLNSKKSSKIKESEEVDLNSNGEAKPEVEQAEPTIEEPKDAKLTESEGKEEPKEEKEELACGKADCGGENCGEDCCDKEKVEESVNMDFEAALEKYREWKMANKGTRGVTLKEKEALKAKLNGKQPMKESLDKCEACGEGCEKSFTVGDFIKSDAMKEFSEDDVKDLTVKDVVDAINESGYVSDVTESTKLCPDCILKGIDSVIDKKVDEKIEKGDFEDMEDVQFEESIEGFKAVVAQYREWKKANYNTAKLTEAEKETLKAKFLEKVSKLNESKEAEKPAENARLTEALAQYKEWKKANHGTDEITKFEEATVARNLILDDITAKLEEAKKFVESGKKHLTEGDVMDAGADAQAAAGAVNDATAMGADPALAGDPNAQAGDPNAQAGVALPQNIVDEISNIKTSIDALATECGIESPVDLGADASAGVPAVTGAADPNADATAVADPNAAPVDPNAGAAPLPESIKSVKARIAARNAQLKETVKFSNTKMADNKDTVKLPSEAELVKGTKSGIAKAADWPVKDVKPSDPKKLKNIEECTQEEIAKMTLDESGEFSWKKYTNMLKNM